MLIKIKCVIHPLDNVYSLRFNIFLESSYIFFSLLPFIFNSFNYFLNYNYNNNEFLKNHSFIQFVFVF